jgi:hypothetical protein
MSHYVKIIKDRDHFLVQSEAMSRQKIVIRKLQVPNIPSMDLRAWYLFLPCGAWFYIGARRDQAKINACIRHDQQDHDYLDNQFEVINTLA